MAVDLGYTNIYRDPKGFPDWQAAGLPIASSPAGLAGTEGVAGGSGRPLTGWAMVWTFIGIFFGGMALNLTPCVYPLIPITVSYFGGRSEAGQGRTAAHGFLYLIGLGLTNSILGITAALTGSLMGALLQHPAVLAAVGLILVFFAFSLFGFWELRLPSALTRAASKPQAGYFGSLFMGLTLGVVAAPCLGPFVLGLLTWVAGLGSPWLGFFVFFVLSLGLGLPLFVLALFSGRISSLPRSGEWMVWVRKLMGWVLLGMAAYFVRPALPSFLSPLVLAAVFLAAGLHLGWIDRAQASFRAFGPIKTIVGLAGLCIATWLVGSWLLLGPGVSWQDYSDSLMAQARADGKPVIMDFSADWCTPCRRLEEETFHDSKVTALAGGRFVMVKVDLTTKGDPLNESLLKEFKIKGVPTVVFLEAGGREREDLRLVDFLPPDQFLARMNQLLTEK